MQQLKIEVRVRDDEARAKRSTVERRSAEHFKEKSQMGSRTKGKRGNEEGRKMRGEERID